MNNIRGGIAPITEDWVEKQGKNIVARFSKKIIEACDDEKTEVKVIGPNMERIREWVVDTLKNLGYEVEYDLPGDLPDFFLEKGRSYILRNCMYFLIIRW